MKSNDYVRLEKDDLKYGTAKVICSKINIW